MKQTIVFGAGCFWGVEKYFKNITGVLATKVGYAGGSYSDPSYDLVLSYKDSDNIINHAEVVLVSYDNGVITTLEILKKFWQIHDPTTLNRQGNDIGNNYRSAIFYNDLEQKKLANITKHIYQKILSDNGYGNITTEITALNKFYLAEDFHQHYLDKNPNGYCPNHATGYGFDHLSTNFYHDLAISVYGKNSDYYNIAYKNATEAKFCQQYDIFKNTADGFFIDKISGERLFDTTSRFNSGTGWLSFYSAMTGSTIELTDLSFGMTRIEVKARVSGAHLGHVFDGELSDAKRRFCINAEVLEFVPK